MPCLPGPGRAEPVDAWRTAPTLLQQVRRCHLEICGGRRAKRALFGQPDREETRRFVKEELAAIRAADQKKYNFDFSNMRPLAGPYEWQPVSAGEVSAAYQLGRLQSGLHQHRSARRIDFEAPRTSTPPEASRCSAASQHEPRPSWPLEANPPRAEPAPVAAAQQRRPTAASTTPSTSPPPESPARRASPRRSAASRQTLITDFLRSRKRPSSFTSCGDSAAKRPSMLSTAAGSGTSRRPTPAPVSGTDTNA